MAQTDNSQYLTPPSAVPPGSRTDFTDELLKLLPSIDEVKAIHESLVCGTGSDDRGRAPELFELLFYTACWVSYYSTTSPVNFREINQLKRMAYRTADRLQNGDLHRMISVMVTEIQNGNTKPQTLPMIMTFRVGIFYQRLVAHLKNNLSGRPSLIMRALEEFDPSLFVDGVFYWTYVGEKKDKECRVLDFNWAEISSAPECAPKDDKSLLGEEILMSRPSDISKSVTHSQPQTSTENFSSEKCDPVAPTPIGSFQSGNQKSVSLANRDHSSDLIHNSESLEFSQFEASVDDPSWKESDEEPSPKRQKATSNEVSTEKSSSSSSEEEEVAVVRPQPVLSNKGGTRTIFLCPGDSTPTSQVLNRGIEINDTVAFCKCIPTNT